MQPLREGESVLAGVVRRAIEAAGGWLPFDRFMAFALYAPGLGYYARGAPVLGSSPADGSDFTTAPEMSPLFGAMLARQVAQALDATGSDDLCKVWLNGKEVLKVKDERMPGKDSDTTDVTLKKGTNVLVAKVVNVTFAWAFCVRFTDRDGKPVAGLVAKSAE